MSYYDEYDDDESDYDYRENKYVDLYKKQRKEDLRMIQDEYENNQIKQTQAYFFYKEEIAKSRLLKELIEKIRNFRPGFFNSKTLSFKTNNGYEKDVEYALIDVCKEFGIIIKYFQSAELFSRGPDFEHAGYENIIEVDMANTRLLV